MTTAGVICEYNPFHNGHKYQLEQTRKNGASHIVCVMSGNFVQRGEAACLPKEVRARAAIENGANIVLELPVAWAVGSAQAFARGAVGLLGATGCVDALSFGSESGDVTKIKECSHLLSEAKTQEVISSLLETGKSYPSAVAQAAEAVGGKQIGSLLAGANDTLAVEYVGAIEALGLKIEPYAVRRTSEHDGGLSAKAIREGMLAGSDYSALVPESVNAEIRRMTERGEAPASLLNAERAVLAALRLKTLGELAQAPDVTGGLENRIYEAARRAESLEMLYGEIKAKSLTHARVRRIILSLFLGVTKSDAQGTPPYIRVLASDNEGLELLKKMKTAANVPVITRYSQVEALDSRGRAAFDLECRSGDLYGLCTKKIRPCGTDMRHKFIRV